MDFLLLLVWQDAKQVFFLIWHFSLDLKTEDNFKCLHFQKGKKKWKTNQPTKECLFPYDVKKEPKLICHHSVLCPFTYEKKTRFIRKKRIESEEDQQKAAWISILFCGKKRETPPLPTLSHRRRTSRFGSSQKPAIDTGLPKAKGGKIVIFTSDDRWLVVKANWTSKKRVQFPRIL